MSDARRSISHDVTVPQGAFQVPSIERCLKSPFGRHGCDSGSGANRTAGRELLTVESEPNAIQEEVRMSEYDASTLGGASMREGRLERRYGTGPERASPR